MSVAPANTASVLIAVSGVVQSPDTYSISGTTLTFSAAPPTGAGNISVRYLGIPATNVTTTAYRTVTEFTATANQTTFSVPSYTVGYIDVYRNGVRLGAADYTATSGTSVILANAAAAGDLVTTESFYVSSVLNAIPAAAGQVNSTYLAAGAASQAFLDAGNQTGTGASLIPTGTTAQRPASPIVGMTRWNTTTNSMEIYIGNNSWQTIAVGGYSVDFVAIGAGGGGGGADGSQLGAGGATGGIVYGTTNFVTGGSYTIYIGGGGGAGGTNVSGSGSGAGGTNGGGNGGNAGSSGSSGAGAGGGGWSGFAYPGPTSYLVVAGGGAGGGGGGEGDQEAMNAGAGGNQPRGVNGTSMSGAAGFNFSGDGGGGGGGGGGMFGGLGQSQGVSLGGSGGGNLALIGAATAGTNGSTAGGAQSVLPSISGSWWDPLTYGRGGAFGAAGNQGVIIFRYLGSQRGTGGIVTSVGGYTLHTFTSNSTYAA
jgi:hypothetical protein